MAAFPRPLIAVALLLSAATAPAQGGDGPEDRALSYLAREVPRWARENHCYSCHNNGDAARALYDARARGVRVASGALDDTTRWLGRPESWDRNGGDGPFSDKRLARLQFTSALAAAVASGALDDRAPLFRAARRLADDQNADGSWPVADGGPAVGSPASYGKPLATLLARDTLLAADHDQFREAVDRADRWLFARPVASVVDASVALLTSAGRVDPAPASLQPVALKRLREGQGDDGGWGPYVDSAPEPFDTALAVLALSRVERTNETRRMVSRGRAYLVATQIDDGSWPETTRPAGAESYAQRLSTAGWATLALLAARGLER